MKHDCSTCEWNFGRGKERVCANVYYGEKISEVKKKATFPCGGWSISFDAWRKQEHEMERRKKRMRKSKIIKLERRGKPKTFIEVKIEDGKLVGVGNPFIVRNAAKFESEDKFELVVDEITMEEM